VGVTPPSSWPGVGHVVSRLPPPTSRPFETRFPCGCAPEALSPPGTASRRVIMQKARGQAWPYGRSPPTACRRVVSGSLSSPVGVLPIVRSRYCCAIGRQGVLSLAGWSPRVRTHFHVLGRTQDPTRPSALPRTGLSPCIAGGSTPFRYGLGSYWWSYNPTGLPRWFGLIRVRSPLLTESRFLSLPPGTEMFQFPGLARALRDQSPFGGSPGLIAACRALAPPGAQTSPTRPYQLGRTAPHPRVPQPADERSGAG
jgi:hypothetical protein